MNSTKSKMAVIKAVISHIMDDSSSTSTSENASDSSDPEAEYACHPRKSTFMETIEKYDANDFRKLFKLNRETVNSLIDLYKSSKFCPIHTHGGRPKVGAKNEVHIFLWYVANTITYRQLGDFFGINEVTTWKIVNRISSWLITIAHQYIIWPRSSEQIQHTTMAFEKFRGISGVLGAIDSTHISIRKPSENSEIYFNQKGSCSIILQAVVDASKKIIDVYCGEPGSMNDARVLRRSTLFRKVAEDNTVFPRNTFLLGDSAYPLKSWLVPPFKDTGNLSNQQKNFNTLHSATRVFVENAFGLMKSRFRRLLHFTEHTNLGTVKNIIVSCCVLHNICIDQNDSWDEMELDIEKTIIEPNSETGDAVTIDRRQEIVNKLIQRNLL